MITVYTRKEVAAWLKISENTLDKMTKNGEIDSTVVGRSRRFTEDHIKKYLKKNETINY